MLKLQKPKGFFNNGYTNAVKAKKFINKKRK